MKSSLILTLVLFVTGCSKSGDGVNSLMTSGPGTSSSEIGIGPVVKLQKIEDRIKEEALKLKAGNGSETEFVENFNKYLQATNDQQVVVEKARTLQEELLSIFDDRLNLYLNLLNASLEGKQAAVKIEIKNDDPKSALYALQSLYTSLSSRKLRTKLTLVDQYLVFDITILLKEKFSVQNQETVPETKIAEFLKGMINDNKKTPQEAFYAYQIAHRLLQSDYALFSAFFPIIAKVRLSEKSNYNEIEVYKRLAGFALKEKHFNFIDSVEKIETFFKNINFIASNAIEKVNTLGIDQNDAYFKTLDQAFNFHTAYLGMVADFNRLNIQEIGKIQDGFIETTYLSLLKSINKNSEIYLNLFKGECKNFQSKELDLILKNFLLAVDKKQETNCVVHLKEKILRRDYTYLDNLKSLVAEENARLSDIGDLKTREYFEQYNQAVLNNWILNIVAKNVNQTELKTVGVQEKLYEIYQTSKRALIKVLSIREINDESSGNLVHLNNEHAIFIKAGKFVGSINTDKALYLHPLAVIVADYNPFIEIASEVTIGGRIDANFIVKNYDVVTNTQFNQTVFKGTQPVQNPSVQVVVSQRSYKERCNNPKPGKNGGGDGGGCADAARGTIYEYQVTKNASEGRTPDQGYVGEKGVSASSVMLSIKKRNLFETTILSFGEQGFKGNQGLNAPRCNQANEYQIYFGRFYTYKCTEDTGGSNNCPQIRAVAESSQNHLREILSLAGKSGNGGEGGNGGNITIRSSDSYSSYPGLSIGGIGGIPGAAATCKPEGQNSGLIGDIGKLGSNGKVEIIK